MHDLFLLQGLSAEEALLFLQTQLHQPSVGEEFPENVPPTVVVPTVPTLQGDGTVEDELEAMISVAEQMTADLEHQHQQEQMAEEQILNIEVCGGVIVKPCKRKKIRK